MAGQEKKKETKSITFRAAVVPHLLGGIDIDRRHQCVSVLLLLERHRRFPLDEPVVEHASPAWNKTGSP